MSRRQYFTVIFLLPGSHRLPTPVWYPCVLREFVEMPGFWMSTQ